MFVTSDFEKRKHFEHYHFFMGELCEDLPFSLAIGHK